MRPSFMNSSRTSLALPIPDDVNSFWNCHSPRSNDVIVFVHRILSDSRACWTSKSGTYWPHLLLNDTRLTSPSIYMGGYTTFAGSGDLRVHNCASELLDDLKLADGAHHSSPLSAS